MRKSILYLRTILDGGILLEDHFRQEFEEERPDMDPRDSPSRPVCSLQVPMNILVASNTCRLGCRAYYAVLAIPTNSILIMTARATATIKMLLRKRRDFSSHS